MKRKKDSSIRDIVRGIKINTLLVITLAVILIVAAFIYVPAVKQELGAKPSEAGGITWGGDSSDSGTPDIGGPPEEALPGDSGDLGPIGSTWKPEGIQTMLAENGKNPDIHNNKVVYQAEGNTTWWDIYMKDLNTGEIKVIANNNSLEGHPKIYSNHIVWHEVDEDGHINNICLYDLLTDETKQIASGKYDLVEKISISYRSPNIYGNLVVWKKVYDQWSSSPPYILSRYVEIQLYNINTEAIETIVHFDLTSPQDEIYIRDEGIDIYKNNVVWSDDSANQGIQRIYVHNIDSGEHYMLDPDNLDKYQKEPAIYDNWIVWLEYYDYDYDFIEKRADLLIAHNLENSQKHTLQSGYNSMEDPSIYQDYVAWSRYWTRIYIHRMSDAIGDNHELTDIPDYQLSPSIFENKIVWAGYYLGDPFSIYMFEIIN